MLKEEHKKFIEDFMLFNCKFCYEIKGFTTCEKIYTRCIDKAMYLSQKMIEKGWTRKSD